jgi:hypothetical protein
MFSSSETLNTPSVSKLYKTGITVLAVLVFQAGIFDLHGSSSNRVAVRTIQAFQFLTKRDRTKITDQKIQSVQNTFFHTTPHPDWITITAFN